MTPQGSCHARASWTPWPATALEREPIDWACGGTNLSSACLYGGLHIGSPVSLNHLESARHPASAVTGSKPPAKSGRPHQQHLLIPPPPLPIRSAACNLSTVFAAEMGYHQQLNDCHPSRNSDMHWGRPQEWTAATVFLMCSFHEKS